MSSTDSPLVCAACQTIDAEDGTSDGQFGKHYAGKVKNENKIIEGLKTAQDRGADAITSFAGSLNFVYIHSVWFGIWIIINLGALGVGLKFDKYPFGLLTMIVSLEAIFLSTFVMVSQNRQAARADLRSQLDFETNIRSEIWSVHIGTALGVNPNHVEEMIKKAIETAKTEA